MTTEIQKEATALNGDAAGVARRAVSTKVRTRCSPKRSREEEVKVQLEMAMPQIVRANVKKAKEGSLVHTKWLWGVANGLPEQGAATSVAELLMEQLLKVGGGAKCGVSSGSGN